ncbi:hypothetical protein ACFW7K_23715 [Streptomyces sp. NPDC058735]|uniref:hypothetical protein n=1 Tax=Streptomyces sp. NPDC058735 TaxID=3346616 RepID=UPI00369C7AE1
MDDAFILLRRATGLLPREARISIGATVEDVRAYERQQDWAFVLDLLLEFGDEHPAPVEFWSLLAAAARQLMLDETARWCDWREGEARHGLIRARLDLLRTEDGGQRTAFSGHGHLRPLWDVGTARSGVGRGRPEFRIALLWVEDAARPAPGERATVRLAPLSPRFWRHLVPGDVITMHEGTPPVGTATIIQASPPVTRPVVPPSARPVGPPVAPPAEIPPRPGGPED